MSTTDYKIKFEYLSRMKREEVQKPEASSNIVKLLISQSNRGFQKHFEILLTKIHKVEHLGNTAISLSNHITRRYPLVGTTFYKNY